MLWAISLRAHLPPHPPLPSSSHILPDLPNPSGERLPPPSYSFTAGIKISWFHKDLLFVWQWRQVWPSVYRLGISNSVSDGGCSMLFCRTPGCEWDNWQSTKTGINDARCALHQRTIAIWFLLLCVESALLEIIAAVCRILLSKLSLKHNLCTHEDSSAHTHHTFSPNVIPHLDVWRNILGVRSRCFHCFHCWLKVDTVKYYKINKQSFMTFL